MANCPIPLPPTTPLIALNPISVTIPKVIPETIAGNASLNTTFTIIWNVDNPKDVAA